jgi:hypothetical protein
VERGEKKMLWLEGVTGICSDIHPPPPMSNNNNNYWTPLFPIEIVGGGVRIQTFKHFRSGDEDLIVFTHGARVYSESGKTIFCITVSYNGYINDQCVKIHVPDRGYMFSHKLIPITFSDSWFLESARAITLEILVKKSMGSQ